MIPGFSIWLQEGNENLEKGIALDRFESDLILYLQLHVTIIHNFPVVFENRCINLYQ